MLHLKSTGAYFSLNANRRQFPYSSSRLIGEENITVAELTSLHHNMFHGTNKQIKVKFLMDSLSFCLLISQLCQGFYLSQRWQPYP